VHEDENPDSGRHDGGDVEDGLAGGNLRGESAEHWS
jgi:hypothetical protein